MTEEEVQAKASRFNLELFKACVKDNKNVTEMFTWLGEQYVERGGEAALFSRPVTAMQDVIAAQSGKTPQPVSTSKTDDNVDTMDNTRVSPISLHKTPLTQRTGGRKSRLPLSCKIL
eukprot:GHVR01006109.1.p1 GENE.GHVR01006109.1~~GHVR01006109.1.p1  ORF type:complete len:126 (-),score=33.02 GHVR01006109.1:224-574(-)